MVTQQSTASRTITAKSGMILPATIDQRTEMNMLVTAIAIYHRFNERKVAYHTLEKIWKRCATEAQLS